jgi:hypothetical protein
MIAQPYGDPYERRAYMFVDTFIYQMFGNSGLNPGTRSAQQIEKACSDFATAITLALTHIDKKTKVSKVTEGDLADLASGVRVTLARKFGKQVLMAIPLDAKIGRYLFEFAFQEYHVIYSAGSWKESLGIFRQDFQTVILAPYEELELHHKVNASIQKGQGFITA